VAASRRLRVIGVAEYVDIPAWNVRALAAKVDTGARTSALHVENVEELGRRRVRFDVRLNRKLPREHVRVEATISRRGRVRSTNGVVKPRLFVEVNVSIGGVRRKIEVGLVDRRNMIYRMLLGRSALARVFLVDPSRRFVLEKSRSASASARREAADAC
jgi:hypothetical protein